MIALLITIAWVTGFFVVAMIACVIGYSLWTNDDEPHVAESRMDCFCPNVGTKEFHESCDDCGRYAEIGGD
jgi:hypothetical protein